MQPYRMIPYTLVLSLLPLSPPCTSLLTITQVTTSTSKTENINKPMPRVLGKEDHQTASRRLACNYRVRLDSLSWRYRREARDRAADEGWATCRLAPAWRGGAPWWSSCWPGEADVRVTGGRSTYSERTPCFRLLARRPGEGEPHFRAN